LTHFGGMVLIQRFCNGSAALAVAEWSAVSQRLGEYQPCDLILALAVCAHGRTARRIINRILQLQAGPFLSLLGGWSAFPTKPTLRRMSVAATFASDHSSVGAPCTIELRKEHFRSALGPFEYPLRLGFGGVDALWPPAARASGLQPEEERDGVRMHPLLLFRSPSARSSGDGSLRPGDVAAKYGRSPFCSVVWPKCPAISSAAGFECAPTLVFVQRGKTHRFYRQLGLGYGSVARSIARCRQAGTGAVRFTRLGCGQR